MGVSHCRWVSFSAMLWFITKAPPTDLQDTEPFGHFCPYLINRQQLTLHCSFYGNALLLLLPEIPVLCFSCYFSSCSSVFFVGSSSEPILLMLRSPNTRLLFSVCFVTAAGRRALNVHLPLMSILGCLHGQLKLDMSLNQTPGIRLQP